MGRDNFFTISNGEGQISIHSPRMGRDLAGSIFFKRCIQFQSTLPAWGETYSRRTLYGFGNYFNPLSPHGERHKPFTEEEKTQLISIHSPRMGRDVLTSDFANLERFQSTLPAWGETHSSSATRWSPENFNPLSPHGERPRRSPATGGRYHFNPLSPHGERPGQCGIPVFPCPFQSTLPAWGETRSPAFDKFF